MVLATLQKALPAQAASVAETPCTSCPCKRKPGRSSPVTVAPTPQVVCGSAVATVTFAASAVTAATPDPAPSKPDAGGKNDGLPPWVSVRVGALAAAGWFLLLGLVLLAMALRGPGRIQFHVPLTFGGRGYGWEASRSLGLLASSVVCSLLAVLLLLQLVNGMHGKADPAKNDKPASSTAVAKAPGS
jgi:hypothetical protein